MNDLMEPLPENRQLATIPNEPPHPLTLVQMAMEKGTSVDQLGKLFDLIERNEKREARAAFFHALTEFKKHPPEILKTKQVSFQNKDGTWTEYKHADLGDAAVAIAQELGKHGLNHHWETSQADGGVIEVRCILSHELGHETEARLRSLPDTSGGKNSIQAVASAVSYLQRYTLFAVTGLSAQEDDDGAKGDPAQTIGEEECKKLAALIKEKNVTNDAFFGWVSEAAKLPIDRLGAIPAYLFQRCVDRLQKTRRVG